MIIAPSSQRSSEMLLVNWKGTMLITTRSKCDGRYAGVTLLVLRLLNLTSSASSLLSSGSGKRFVETVRILWGWNDVGEVSIRLPPLEVVILSYKGANFDTIRVEISGNRTFVPR